MNEKRIIDGETWVKVPRCDSCTGIHPTLPTVRFYHSPLCDARLRCAECGVTFLTGSDGQVGEICAGCALGDEALG